MAKVRTRHDTKKLFIDFMYKGERCREQTMLTDTPANRKKLEMVVQRMEAKILLGQFEYADFFPGSKNIQRLQAAGVLDDLVNGQETAGTYHTPLFTDFADLWFQENKIQWRGSHTKNVDL